MQPSTARQIWAGAHRFRTVHEATGISHPTVTARPCVSFHVTISATEQLWGFVLRARVWRGVDLRAHAIFLTEFQTAPNQMSEAIASARATREPMQGDARPARSRPSLPDRFRTILSASSSVWSRGLNLHHASRLHSSALLEVTRSATRRLRRLRSNLEMLKDRERKLATSR